MDSFEMVNNELPPQKRRSTKERVMIRTRDPDTLLTFSVDQCPNIFRIASEKPVVQWADSRAVVLYVPKVEPTFNINRKVCEYVSPCISNDMHASIKHRLNYGLISSNLILGLIHFLESNPPTNIWAPTGYSTGSS